VLPFVLWFFVYKSELRLKVRHFILHLPIIKDYRTEFCDFFKTRRSEYFSNHTQSYFVLLRRTFHRRLRIISRMLMFALFLFSESHKGLFQLLVIITELKIMKGSRNIQISIKYAALLASLILFYTLLQRLLYPFYYRSKVIAETPDALRWYLQLLYYCHPVNRAAIFRRREMLRKRCC
jgi:hypothetical protein